MIVYRYLSPIRAMEKPCNLTRPDQYPYRSLYRMKILQILSIDEMQMALKAEISSKRTKPQQPKATVDTQKEFWRAICYLLVKMSNHWHFLTRDQTDTLIGQSTLIGERYLYRNDSCSLITRSFDIVQSKIRSKLNLEYQLLTFKCNESYVVLLWPKLLVFWFEMLDY